MEVQFKKNDKSIRLDVVVGMSGLTLLILKLLWFKLLVLKK